ncbi:MAG: hypothetical protein ABSG01_11960 [Anaerolineales bacterium]|jgi:ABC-type antimicrobial peptide transport system permease subunit
MSKLSVITIAGSAGVILLTLLITAAPLVWISAIAAGLFLGIYPVFRAARLEPVKARRDE